MAAALAFDDPEDAQSVDLQRMLRELDAATFTTTVTGLEEAHPLFARIRAAVQARQAELAR
jgi:mannitol-1-phosphate 5-dehydrogenase